MLPSGSSTWIHLLSRDLLGGSENWIHHPFACLSHVLSASLCLSCHDIRRQIYSKDLRHLLPLYLRPFLESRSFISVAQYSTTCALSTALGNTTQLESNVQHQCENNPWDSNRGYQDSEATARPIVPFNLCLIPSIFAHLLILHSIKRMTQLNIFDADLATCNLYKNFFKPSIRL